MSGSRTKKLRKDSYPEYMKLHEKFGSRVKPFKSVFRQVKKNYSAGFIK